MLLTEKLQELEQTKVYFNNSLNEAKTLLNTNVKSAVNDEINEKIESLKESLKAHFINQITQNIQEQLNEQLNQTNINELFTKWLQESERVFYALQISINSFLKANNSELKQKAFENIDNLDFKSFLRHSQDEINEILNEFKVFIANEMLETSTLKEKLLKEFIEKNKDEVIERVDLSFLRADLLEDERILNSLKEQLILAIEKKFKDKSFENSVYEIMKIQVKSEIQRQLSSYDVLRLRFQNAASVLALCLQNEIASITSSLKAIKELEYYEQKLKNKKEVINKTYEVR